MKEDKKIPFDYYSSDLESLDYLGSIKVNDSIYKYGNGLYDYKTSPTVDNGGVIYHEYDTINNVTAADYINTGMKGISRQKLHEILCTHANEIYSKSDAFDAAELGVELALKLFGFNIVD